MPSPRKFLRTLFDTAVASALPENCMPRWLPPQPGGRVVVVGAGKAAAAMASVLEDAWPGPLEGLVIVPYGHGASCRNITVIEAAHPVPDEAGVAAAARLLECVDGLAADDTVVCLLSGGGSALLCQPADGLSLAEKQAATARLLASGATIHEINCVRKKLSAVKGGKLAARASPARVLTFAISDVPGNDPATIASGPTVSDTASPREALAILDRHRISLSPLAERIIANSAATIVADSDVRIFASSDDALIAAAVAAADNGITPYSLGDLSGSARDLAADHASLARAVAGGGGPVEAPCVLLSGGESTVEVVGPGRGGRNGEYALSLAIALAGQPNVHAIACDTDGIDGVGDNAGACISPDTLGRATAAGRDAATALRDNDSYGFFDAIGDLVTTGPTCTNVNDFRAIFIGTDED